MILLFSDVQEKPTEISCNSPFIKNKLRNLSVLFLYAVGKDMFSLGELRLGQPSSHLFVTILLESHKDKLNVHIFPSWECCKIK